MLKCMSAEYPDVSIQYSGAEQAAIVVMGYTNMAPSSLSRKLVDDRLFVKVTAGEIFETYPYLAIKKMQGDYYHHNFDVIDPKRESGHTCLKI